VCIANLIPESRSEIDSYMYQSVAQELVSTISSCIGVPLVQSEIIRKPTSITSNDYTTDPNDEVEDLFDLLSKCKSL